MRRYRYHRVDVFTDQPFGGNPLAVFPDADELSADEMQVLAREMNLSESVFVQTPSEKGADVRLRIFTVEEELPLAGHPVVGAHFVLAATGRYHLGRGATTVRAQLGVGVLAAEVHVVEGTVREVLMTQRRPRFGDPIGDPAMVARALGVQEVEVCPADLPVRVVDTGVPWLMLPVRDRRALQGLRPDPQACTRLSELAGTPLLYAFTQDTDDPDCTARSRHVFYGRTTPGEDPVTGSAAGCLSAYLVAEGVVLAAPTAELKIEQGVEIGRRGAVRAQVELHDGVVTAVRVGGSAVHVGDGEIWW